MTDTAAEPQNLEIFALKMAGGAALVLVQATDDAPLMATNAEGQVLGMLVNTGSASRILTNVREVGADVLQGVLSPRMFIPMETAVTLPVIAQFDLTGVVLAVSDDATGPWDDLRKASVPVSFLSTSAHLRLVRDLTAEVIPGVLITPAGDVAVRDDDGWTVIDTLDPDAVCSVLLPHLLARRKTADWNAVFADLLRFVPPYIAQDAVEDYDDSVMGGLDRPDTVPMPVRPASMGGPHRPEDPDEDPALG